MSALVQAAIDDLEALSRDLTALDEELQPMQAELTAAVARAWATSGAFLGALAGTDAAVAAHLRRCGELAIAPSTAALGLRAAGSTGGLWAALPGDLGGPAARLAASAIADAVRHPTLPGRLQALVRRLFAGSDAPPAYVVETTTYRTELKVVGELSHEVVREVLSDGTARVTVLKEGSLAAAVGVGGSCSLEVDGYSIAAVIQAASISAGVHTAIGEVWRFASAAEADTWIDDQRWTLRATAMRDFTPIVGPALAVISHATGNRWLPGPGTPDERYEEVGGEALAAVVNAARLADLGFTNDGSVSTDIRARRNDDGTVTISQDLSVTASTEGAAVAAGSAQLGLDRTVAVTADLGGNIVAVSVRTVKLDEPGLAPALGGAGDVGSMSATTTRLDELSVYESELVVDFRDGRTRNELEAALGIDLTDRASQVRAALAVVQQAPSAVRAASVAVLERSAPNDQMWGLACSVPQVLEIDLGVGHGQISQRTLAAAYKAPGEDQLRPLAVPAGG